jgi:hypothetical protein
MRSDKALVNNIVSHSQSTHKLTASNSVGMAALMLREHFFGSLLPSEAVVNSQYEKCIQELKEHANQRESRSAAIQNIILKTEQPLHKNHDYLTLYVPSNADKTKYEEKEFIFPLKEVLILVWQAIHENKKFATVHNYQNAKTQDERDELAKKDLVERESSFFNALENIRTDQVCHHGDRNELIFELNGTYDGMHLIEDERATITYFLKENLAKRFFKTYQTLVHTSVKEKEKIVAALFTWMEANNALAILQLLDPKDTFKKSLHELFVKNGCNPGVIKLDSLINEALGYLEFACDPRHEEIYNINEIFNIPEIDGQLEVNATITTMKDWIKNNYQLNNKEHRKIVENFHKIYLAHSNLEKYSELLVMTDKMKEEFVTLPQKLAVYFSEIRNIR